MLQPKRSKFRKFQKGKGKGGGIVGNQKPFSFGQFGVKALLSGSLASKQIETIRRTLTREFQRSGQVWIRIFPTISVTRKPAEVRMGKGKGSPEFWIAKFQAGQVLFEMDGISLETAKKATLLVQNKLSFPIKFVELK